MPAAFAVRVLASLGLATPASPQGAEVVHVLGDDYFRLELSLAEPSNASFLGARGAACPGTEGPVSQVYLLPFGADSLLHEAASPGSWPDAQAAPPWRPVLVGRAHANGTATVLLDAVLWGDPPPVRLSLPDPRVLASGEEVPSWVRAWALACLVDAHGLHYEEGYSEFLDRAFAHRFQVEPPSLFPDFFQWAPTPGLYDLFTGGAALRESVQFDRVLETVLGEVDMVPVSGIEPLALEDHPFLEMRGGRDFVASELARLCPSSALYLRLPSLEEWFALEDLLERWGGSFLSAVQVNGRDQGVVQRYRRQLALDQEVLGQLLGAALVGELAVVATDPLFREGAGLAVVFSARDGREQPFHALFEMHRRLLASTPGRSVEELDLGGLPVDWCRDAAGEVNSYHLVLQDRHVFSNSLALLQDIVVTARGAAPSLYAAPDFQYYRALYPRSEAESAFLFLSQDWFRKITGPGWRIAHGRRRVAAQWMQDVHHAWQSTAAPGRERTLAELAELGWVDGATVHALGVRLDPATGSVSTPQFGSLDHLRPIDEIIPDQVSEGEVLLYDSFREDYEQYWRQFIDPVGIQVRRTQDRLEVETLILPLIDNSIYEMLRAFSGDPSGAPAQAPPLPGDALGAVTLRWSPREAGLGELLQEIASGGFRPGVEFDDRWLGRTVTLGVADGDLLFTAASDSMLGQLGWLGSGFGGPLSLAATALLSALTLPTFAALEVQDAAALGQFLDSLWRQAATRRSWWDGAQVRSCTTAGEPRIHTVTFTLFVIEVRIHYAFAGPWLLLTTRPRLLEEWLQRVRGEPSSSYPYNGSLTVRPQAFQRAADTVAIVWQERIARACLDNLAPLERAARAGWSERAGEFLGYLSVCPEGGTYERVGSQLRCTTHGTPRDRLQRLEPPDTAAAVQLVRGLADLTVDFSFTGDGLRSCMTAHFTKESSTDPR